MANKTTTKKKATTAANPTLHGLLIARSFSGTVVRTLLFVLLTGAVVFVAGVAVMSDSSAGVSHGVAALVIAGLLYLIFDVAYVLMSNIRPFHPRVDRVVLPLSLLFALAIVYVPVFITEPQPGFIEAFWLSGAVALLCVLAIRLGVVFAFMKPR